MRATVTVTALGTALLFGVTSAQALGFGSITNPTQLGQALNFGATVRLDADETLARECVSAEVFSGDNKLPAGVVRTAVDGAANANERNVRITTTTLIDEPVVTVSITVGCTAKVTRRFVAFIDPPVINLAQAASTDSPPTPPRAVAPETPLRAKAPAAPQVAVAQAGRSPSSAAPRKGGGAPKASPGSRARAAAMAPTVASVKPVPPAATPVPPRKVVLTPRMAAVVRPAASAGGARLQLETAPALVAKAASGAALGPAALPAVAAPAPTASAVQGEEQAQQIAMERQRIVELEQGLARLRGDGQATQQAVAALQMRLREAESARYANPVVYGLALLSALLALGVAALWWRQSRSNQASQWWSASTHGAAAEPPEAPPPVATPVPLAPTSTLSGAFEVSTVDDDDLSPRTLPAPTPTLPIPVRALPAQSPAPKRESSVEELIDLEQQVEFFIVLGQDEAAIELLMSHVRRDGGSSPLPHLKLLDIYRRRGDSAAYERIRERFNRRFNAYAPSWASDLQRGRSLEDYPDLITRLQGLWVTPPRAMETIDASLFRRNRADDTFDLPAYRDLLFLYAISRDLTALQAVGPKAEVDLWLPLGDESGVEPIMGLVPTAEPADVQRSDMMPMSFDLGVSDQSAAERSTTTPAAEAAPQPNGRSVTRDSRFIDLDAESAARPKRPEAGSLR